MTATHLTPPARPVWTGRACGTGPEPGHDLETGHDSLAATTPAGALSQTASG
ncbi:hypothetical protein KN815_05705 [Streptomyces sp. 4503]|uniref:Uncharacterized protein n=1 Tax=Streptomyces niphimycinicus TaxID=2842201 RepID=A0ABS6C9Q1_9ACTN|nr:hypothetical protein [Streptomyces niphimycinicus]MBU3863602.1 hypothetical protein [Streptomyces niphimycinicus]